VRLAITLTRLATFFKTLTALFFLWGGLARAQFAYEGVRMDVGYKIFIYAKESLGPGKWRFQTKAVYSTGGKPYFSDWRTADCYESTINGKVVPAISRYGVEAGEPEVLRAVCGYK
jgi:hypothetical protein